MRRTKSANKLTAVPWVIALLAVIIAAGQQWSLRLPASRVGSGSPTIQVYFSPKGGCTEAIVEELRAAQRTVRVQAYSFTNRDIAAALRDAKRRGVDVEIVLDKSNETAQYSAATFTSNAGIPTYIDDEHAIAHNKVMIIDGETVITGSFNFTKAAENRNAENLLIIKNAPDIVRQYERNYEEHKAHSHLYRRFTPRSRWR
ncbi:MAG: phospholipase D family protein [Abditibacteriales bacterium]|nr:phospholipase D family protein [Abditibacteriales bacterium]MDW8367411.1 phospholipase D family protein [Abditibacteriales bacterium]